jgi:hypothetical protein
MMAIGFLGYITSPLCWVEIIYLDIFNLDLLVESLFPLFISSGLTPFARIRRIGEYLLEFGNVEKIYTIVFFFTA